MSASRTESARRDLAALLLSRGAVRRGRHIRFHCPAHDDRRPSADYEPTLAVWVCRSCGAGGGARDLAQRLGVASPETPPSRRQLREISPPPPRVSRKAWAPAWTAIVNEARRQEHRLAPYREVWRGADWHRARHQAIAGARRRASAMGDDDPAAWHLLGQAARVSTAVASMEAMLDDAMRWIAR